MSFVLLENAGSFEEVPLPFTRIPNENEVFVLEDKILSSQDYSSLQPDSLIRVLNKKSLCETCLSSGVYSPTIDCNSPFCSSCADGYPRFMLVKNVWYATDDHTYAYFRYYTFEYRVWVEIQKDIFFSAVLGSEYDPETIPDPEEPRFEKYILQETHTNRRLLDKRWSRSDVKCFPNGLVFNIETKIITWAHPWHAPFTKDWNLIEDPKVDLIACCSHFTDEPENFLTYLRCILNRQQSDYFPTCECLSYSYYILQDLYRPLCVAAGHCPTFDLFKETKQEIMIKKIRDPGLLKDPEIRDNFYSALLLS